VAYLVQVSGQTKNPKRFSTETTQTATGNGVNGVPSNFGEALLIAWREEHHVSALGVCSRNPTASTAWQLAMYNSRRYRKHDYKFIDEM
jgi:predicted secreted protein